MTATQLRPMFVDFIPDTLESGVLYVSRRYSTASHLCCCGCGTEVVTPLNPAKWRLIEKNGMVTLTPSIGNWSFPCQSHYWVRDNRVQWAAAMAPEIIQAVQARDRRDAVNYAPKRLSWWVRSYGLLAERLPALARRLMWWR